MSFIAYALHFSYESMLEMDISDFMFFHDDAKNYIQNLE